MSAEVPIGYGFSSGPKLTELCSEVGVAVVAEPEIKGARINGAARWLTPTKAIVQLSLRHRWSDIFWFTFFHELGHLLMHSKKEMFINDVGAHTGSSKRPTHSPLRSLSHDRRSQI